MEPHCPIDVLPNELLIMIFEQLHRRYQCRQTALNSCILVNKRWNTLALPILWSCILLDSCGVLKSHDSDPVESLDRQEIPPNRINHNPFSRNSRTPLDGVLEIQPAHLANLNFCREVLLRLIGIDLTDVQYFVLNCNNLRHIHACVDSNDSKEFIQAWRHISRHFVRVNPEILGLSMYLRTESSLHFLFRKYTDPLLTRRLTHLSINHTSILAEEITMLLSTCLKLKVFFYILTRIINGPAPQHFTPSQNKRFWESLERLELERLSFPASFVSLKWAGGIATLPCTLLTLKVTVYDTVPLDLTIIFQQLEMLQTLEVDGRPNAAFEFSAPKGTFLQDIAASCHHLRRLNLGLSAPMALIAEVCYHCRMIESIVLPRDIRFEETEFLGDLPRLKEVEVPLAVLLSMPNLARQWAKHLPLLKIMVVNTYGDSLPSDTVDAVGDVVLGRFDRNVSLDTHIESPNREQRAKMREQRARMREKRKLVKWFCSMLRRNSATGCIYLDMEEVRANIGIAT